jgi:CelD/BcsL family acetyltransferase involved in cellulose biosynthesis
VGAASSNRGLLSPSVTVLLPGSQSAALKHRRAISLRHHVVATTNGPDVITPRAQSSSLGHDLQTSEPSTCIRKPGSYQS